MRAMGDWELLQAWAKQRSEAAFAELVQRHLHWVYSAALRQVRDRALAEEVTQSVFALLAHKADRLRRDAIVAGWLFRSTRFVAIAALRAQRRRQRREETASAMNAIASSDNLWNQLAPHLDEAVAALSEKDRAAVLLRFYEKKTLREVGAQLGVSEEAAKKRVARALDKMREHLTRRGMVFGAVGLAGLLTEQTVQAAPAALGIAVVKSATAGAAALPALARETLQAWRLAKLKLAAGIAAVGVTGMILTTTAILRREEPAVPPSPTGVAAALRARESQPAVAPPLSVADTNALVLDIARFYRTRFVIENQTNATFQSIVGRQVIDGLPFEIGGQAMLYGQSADRAGGRFPEAFDGIRVGRRFDELHLIHHTLYQDAQGQTVALIRLNYEDGTAVELPIQAGVHVRDWFRTSAEETEILADPNTKVIFRGRLPAGAFSGTRVRLFKSVLRNPDPGKTVATMDIVSARHKASYALVAATVANRQDNRPVTRPWPDDEPARRFDGTLTVRVVDQSTGAPVEGALVGWSIEGEQLWGVVPPFWTSAAGEGVIRYPVDRTKIVKLSVEKEGYAAASTQLSNQIPAEVTVSLSPAQRIGGVVLDEQGHQIAGVQIKMFDDASLSAFTDASGRWSLGLPAGGTGPIEFVLNHKNFAQVKYTTADTPAGSATDEHVNAADLYAGTAVLRLPNGYRLDGRVLNSESQPVSGATVLIGQTRNATDTIKLNTDNDGRFHAMLSTLGSKVVMVDAPDYAPEFQRITIDVTNELLEITLKPGRALRGRVVDLNGNPLEGVDVSFTGGDAVGWYEGEYMPGDSQTWRVKTSADGRFTWNRASADGARLSFAKAGFRSRNGENLKPSDAEQTIVLRPVLHVRGTVTDAANGQPISRFEVILGSRWGEDGRIVWNDRAAKSGVNGQFEEAVGSEQTNRVLRVVAEGYEPSEPCSIDSNQSELVLDFRLHRGAWITGTIRTPDGVPVRDAKVYLATPNQPVSIMNGQRDEWSPTRLRVNVTGNDGQFRISPPGEPFTVVALHDQGYAEAESSVAGPLPDLILIPWAKVEGIVRIGSKVGARETVQLQRNRSQVYFSSQATTGEDGRFLLDHVPAGDAVLGRWVCDKQRFNCSMPAPHVRIQINPGETAQAMIGGIGRPVVGRLVAPANIREPIDWSRFSTQLHTRLPRPRFPDDWPTMTDEQRRNWAQQWGNTEEGKAFQKESKKKLDNIQIFRLSIRPDGSFRVEEMPPGEYELNVLTKDWPTPKTAGWNGMLHYEFTVSEIPGGYTDEPLDLGALVLKPVESQPQ